MLSFILALAAAATPAGDTSFAIVVGNNQSPVLGRRSLQYADDDAVKYAEVFRASLAPENLRLLTTADEDTARLFPETLTKAVKPAREILKQSFQEMVTAIRQGKQAGHHTRAWFIFAGHGDVDRGRGFIELADGAFTGDDLVAALKEVDADEMHVILDSCNSYFVLAPRKPGGRHFATPADAALELSQRLPKVGVLLSTSAEAEVYEWSAFQSGIFSHAVRSALTGAADVNGDGRVSYAEVAAFVDTASRSVPNPVLRPQVFARGPDGDNARPLLDNNASTAVQLDATQAAPLRLTVRDAHGVRWFDLNAEAQMPLKLRLPSAVAQGLSIEEESAQGVKVWKLPEALTTVAWAQLASGGEMASARGADQALKALYQLPFGPTAFAQWEQRAKTPATSEYIGLAKQDVERMRIILAQAAKRDRNGRITAAWVFGAASAGFLVGGVVETALPGKHPIERVIALSSYGGSALLMGGLTALFVNIRSPWEHEFSAFEESTLSGDWRGAVARADDFIDQRAAAIRRARWLFPVLGVLIAVLGGTVTAISYLIPNAWPLRPAGFALLGEGIGIALAMPWQNNPEEDLLNVWREERQLLEQAPKVDIGIAPVRGGLVVGLSGTF